MEAKPNIVVIVGPTASGKTSLGIHLAKKFNGEVISADSRQVYKGLDIGTGKVTEEEMKGVPHHLLDVANPEDTYTVTEYVEDARKVIAGVSVRGKLPIIVGGTFLYIDSLLGKISAPPVPPNESLRAELEGYTCEELALKLRDLDSLRYESIDTQNKRRLIRAIEIATTLGSVPQTVITSPYNTLTLGISLPKEVIKENIRTRLHSRLKSGIIEEVQSLHVNGLPYERLMELGIEYKYISQYLLNTITHDEMCTLIETKSIQYAKRQMTWLKRDTSIIWVNLEDLESIEKILSEFIY